MKETTSLERTREIRVTDDMTIVVHIFKEEDQPDYNVGWWIGDGHVHNNIRCATAEDALNAHKKMCETIEQRLRFLFYGFEQKLDWFIVAQMGTF